MKVAVCLSGECRYVADKFHGSFVENLMEPLKEYGCDIDVYFHFWRSPWKNWDWKLSEKRQFMVDLLQPTKYIWEAPKSIAFGPRNLGCMMHSVHQANTLAQSEEYDLVVRTRLDLRLHKPVPQLPVQDPNYLYLRELRPDSKLYNDHFAMGSQNS